MRRAIDNTVDRLDVDGAMRVAIRASEDTHPHPNPRVGAVILSPDGEVRSIGAHIAPGMPHAEVDAIRKGSVPGDTMVVTLEPCNHDGRTAPCTDAIIDAGIARVAVGAIDPDPRVSGSGIARLTEAGIDVRVGILGDEVEANDPAYFHHRRTGRARVTLKLASTLDGQVAALDGSSRWITSEPARLDAHALRAANDAVLVGAGTVITDDPDLSVRLPGHIGPQPRPVVLAGRRDLPDGARVRARNAIVYRGDDGTAPLDVVRDLPRYGILGVLVEGGPAIARSFLDAGCVDEIVWYVGATLAGGVGVPPIAGDFATITDATPITITSVAQVGPDVRITARPGRG